MGCTTSTPTAIGRVSPRRLHKPVFSSRTSSSSSSVALVLPQSQSQPSLSSSSRDSVLQSSASSTALSWRSSGSSWLSNEVGSSAKVGTGDCFRRASSTVLFPSTRKPQQQRHYRRSRSTPTPATTCCPAAHPQDLEVLRQRRSTVCLTAAAQQPRLHVRETLAQFAARQRLQLDLMPLSPTMAQQHRQEPHRFMYWRSTSSSSSCGDGGTTPQQRLANLHLPPALSIAHTCRTLGGSEDLLPPRDSKAAMRMTNINAVGAAAYAAHWVGTPLPSSHHDRAPPVVAVPAHPDMVAAAAAAAAATWPGQSFPPLVTEAALARARRPQQLKQHARQHQRLRSFDRLQADTCNTHTGGGGESPPDLGAIAAQSQAIQQVAVASRQRRESLVTVLPALVEASTPRSQRETTSPCRTLSGGASSADCSADSTQFADFHVVIGSCPPRLLCGDGNESPDTVGGNTGATAAHTPRRIP